MNTKAEYTFMVFTLNGIRFNVTCLIEHSYQWSIWQLLKKRLRIDQEDRNQQLLRNLTVLTLRQIAARTNASSPEQLVCLNQTLKDTAVQEIAKSCWNYDPKLNLLAISVVKVQFAESE